MFDTNRRQNAALVYGVLDSEKRTSYAWNLLRIPVHSVDVVSVRAFLLLCIFDGWPPLSGDGYPMGNSPAIV